MIINFKDDEIQLIKNELDVFLESKGFEVTKLNDKSWIIKNEEEGIDKILFKSNELFKNFGYENSNTSTGPHYALLDDVNFEILFIFIRAQMGTGSVVQKLAYSDFVLTDYLKSYPKIEEYDLRVANVMTSFHSDPTLSELLKYLRSNSISNWVNKIKI